MSGSDPTEPDPGIAMRGSEMDLLKYVELDGTTHVIGPGEYTVCGVVIPQGGTWSTDEPKKLCSACKSRAKDTDEFGSGKPKA